VSQAITNIRSATSHDTDDQISTTQYLAWLQLEQDILRARLAASIPNLYSTTATTVLADQETIIPLPDDFLATVRIEKIVGATYYPVCVSDGLSTNGLSTGLEFRRENNQIIVSPPETSAGTYRHTYIYTSAVLDYDDDENSQNDSTLEVPLGLEDVICERVAARVRIRCEEDPSPHEARAERIWAMNQHAIRKIYGAHPVTGLRRSSGIRGWYGR